MDFLSARRPGAKYGRSKKKVLVHNLFEVRETSGSSAIYTSRDEPISPASPGTLRRPVEDVLSTPLTAKRLKPAHITNHSSPSPSECASTTLSGSEMTQRSAATDLSLFEMISSDEDQGGHEEPRVAKKRKITQALHSGSRRAQSPSGGKNHNDKLATPGRANTSKSKPQLKTTKQFVVKSGAHEDIRDTAGVARSTSDETQSTARPRRTIPRSKVINVDCLPSTTPKLAECELRSKDTRTTGTNDSSRSPTLPWDYPGDSEIPSSCTPKTKDSFTFNSVTDVSSPSQLALTQLRLSPENSLLLPRSEVLDDSKPKNSPPRRGRQRLIDRLDAPEKPPSSSRRWDSDESRAASPDSSINPGAYNNQISNNRLQQRSNVPSLPRSDSSSTRQIHAKPRATYAKERSHLADMVDDIGGLSDASSQMSSQQLASQLALTTGSSQLQLELDLEDESSEEQVGPGKLKSIHELRQTGATNRFDRELETLLDDIDPDATSSKSLRVTSLMKLMKRLGERAFQSYVIERALGRLTSWVTTITDITSIWLLGMIFWKLAVAGRSSARTMSEIFSAALVVGGTLLRATDSIANIIKDRKQNLSKSSIREVNTFEKHVLQADLLPEYAGDTVHPHAVALGCLREALKGLVELQNRSSEMSSSSYELVIGVLEEHVRSLQSGSTASMHRSVIQMALSFLELCSGMFGDDHVEMRNGDYQALGGILARIMNWARETQDDIDQSALRLVVSLSNNKPQVCKEFGLSSITDAIITVVDKDFLILTDQAEHQQIVDQAKLDAVILSLGCLLNLAECEASIRLRMVRSKVNGSNTTHLECLVNIFNQEATTLPEATTPEQSQVLVAFGYLSMLLCTLSLESSVRGRIIQLLSGKSFEDLCAAAETFFTHLKTLDEQQRMLLEDENGYVQQGGEAVNGFTERFGRILRAIRAG